MYVFLRTLGDDRILVVLNGSDKPKTFAMPIGDRAWRSCRLDDLIGGGVTKPAGSDAAIEVRAFGARVVRVAEAADASLKPGLWRPEPE